MKWLSRPRISRALIATVLLSTLAGTGLRSQIERRAMTSETDFRQAMDELSNWGRWGTDDELGAANFITPQKRKDAASLVAEGRSVSLAHDIIQEETLEGPWYLDRQVMNVSDTGAADRYQYLSLIHI